MQNINDHILNQPEFYFVPLEKLNGVVENGSHQYEAIAVRLGKSGFSVAEPGRNSLHWLIDVCDRLY